jgi:probable addiction module antidote protein
MDVQKTKEFSKWLDGLNDLLARARVGDFIGRGRQRFSKPGYQNRAATCQEPARLLSTMKKTKTTRYNVAEHLRTPEEMAAYFEACLEEGGNDAGFIAKALGDIARAKGMTQVARDAGLSRESLYKALSGDRSPAFETVLKVVGALGLKLHAQAVKA